MTDRSDRQSIGRHGLTVPLLGLGCGTLGDPTEVIPEAQAQATLAAAWDRGIRYFDTAPWYGNTKSEHRVGHFLRQKSREDYVISTKVGRVYFTPDDPVAYRNSPWMKRWRGGLPFDLRFDYSRSGIMRAYEDSLMRLGINRVDALVIHDLDLRHQRSEEGIAAAFEALDAGGGYAALDALRRGGEIQAVGVGINHVGMIPRFLDRFEIDYFLVAMPYTLLDQPALDGEFQLCAERGARVVIGAVFASGILATGARADALYAYQPAEREVAERVRRIEAVCRRHDVPLIAAALQFPAAHPVVASVIPGANAPGQVNANVEAFERPIPEALWRDLKADGLLRPDAPTPAARGTSGPH